MEKNPLLQEVVFASADKEINRQISKEVKKGVLKKIAPRIYSTNLTDTAENIIRRNLFSIIGNLFPGALLSHRTALEFKPTAGGKIFLTYKYTKNVTLPGVVLCFMKGKGPTEGDNLFTAELYASQKERALLENLQSGRMRDGEYKTVSRETLELQIEQILQVRGEIGLNEIRDRAKQIAKKTGMQKEFSVLNKLISAILATHSESVLISPQAKARALGFPYDSQRISLFENLFIELNTAVFEDRHDRNRTATAYRNFAFFEAYFSNYIEGTEFEVSDARKIVETGMPMKVRDEDSHDVLGTYKLVSNQEEMSITPKTADEMLQILSRRHKTLLSARVSKNPGEFKDRNNRAGNTHFVDFALVRGTLLKGFEYYRLLPHPLSKAAYMLFLILEVHPFSDGNGRVARVMMNAELSKAGFSKIMIPTVYREDYILALKAMSRNHDPRPYIRMLDKAQKFSAEIQGEDIDRMELMLKQRNAFGDPSEDKLII